MIIPVKSVMGIFAALLMAAGTILAQSARMVFSYDCLPAAPSPGKVTAIDNRLPGQLLGFLPGMIPVTFDGELADSLSLFFVAAGTQDGPVREIVVILNELFVSGASKPQKFKLFLRVFEKMGSSAYSEILSVDSVYSIGRKKNPEALFDLVSRELCRLSERVEKIKPPAFAAESRYSLSDLHHLDSLEKRQLPMFVDDAPRAGIYKDYEHFKHNDPDIPVKVIIDTTGKRGVRVYRFYKDNKKRAELDPKGVYAVSDGEKLLKIAGDGEYFAMQRIGLDFYYRRPVSFAEQTNTFFPNSYAAQGRIGTNPYGDRIIRLGPLPTYQGPWYLFKINHRKGNSIPVAEL